MTMSVDARNATSPPSRPKPESMKRLKTSVNRSMTPVFISPSLMEHLDGLGLIAPARPEKLIELRAGLLLVGGEAGAIKALGTGLCRHERGQIDQLPCLQ